MSFESSLNYGRIGEKQVMRFLEKNNIRYTDVAEGRKFDLYIEDFPIEVKRDSNIGMTGNIFAEVMTNMERDTKGWFNTSKAKYIFYISEKTNKCFIFKLDDLREYQEEKQINLQIKHDYSKTIQYFLVNVFKFQEWLIARGKTNYIVQLDKPEQNKFEW